MLTSSRHCGCCELHNTPHQSARQQDSSNGHTCRKHRHTPGRGTTGGGNRGRQHTHKSLGASVIRGCAPWGVTPARARCHPPLCRRAGRCSCLCPPPLLRLRRLLLPCLCCLQLLPVCHQPCSAWSHQGGTCTSSDCVCMRWWDNGTRELELSDARSCVLEHTTSYIRAL